MILFTESGSTKTDYVIINEKGVNHIYSEEYNTYCKGLNKYKIYKSVL